MAKNDSNLPIAATMRLMRQVAARAVARSLALDDYAQSFRQCWKEKGVAVGVTRIGVHPVPAIVGNVGGNRCFDYVASRLEAADKQLGRRVLVSAPLAETAASFRGGR